MGAKITALEIQQNNRERVNIYLDGEFAFGLNLMDAARLYKGQELSEAEIQQLQEGDRITRAYEQAVRFLGTRPRSQAEVRRKLKEKEVAPAVIDVVLNRLEQNGYLNDREFARYWISNREMFNPRSAGALRYELREKGVSSTLIDEVLEVYDETAAALQAAQKKAGRLREKDPQLFRQKLIGYLVQRGFDYETARGVVDQIREASEEVDDDSTEF